MIGSGSVRGFVRPPADLNKRLLPREPAEAADDAG